MTKIRWWRPGHTALWYEVRWWSEMISMNWNTHRVKVSVSADGAGGISDITGKDCGQSALWPAAQWLLLCHRAAHVSQRLDMKSIHVSLCSSHNGGLHVYRSGEFLQGQFIQLSDLRGSAEDDGTQAVCSLFWSCMKEIRSTVPDAECWRPSRSVGWCTNCYCWQFRVRNVKAVKSIHLYLKKTAEILRPGIILGIYLTSYKIPSSLDLEHSLFIQSFFFLTALLCKVCKIETCKVIHWNPSQDTLSPEFTLSPVCISSVTPVPLLGKLHFLFLLTWL